MTVRGCLFIVVATAFPIVRCVGGWLVMRWRRWEVSRAHLASTLLPGPPGTSMGSRNPLTSHLDGEEGVVDNLKKTKKSSRGVAVSFRRHLVVVTQL